MTLDLKCERRDQTGHFLCSVGLLLSLFWHPEAFITSTYRLLTWAVNKVFKG